MHVADWTTFHQCLTLINQELVKLEISPNPLTALVKFHLGIGFGVYQASMATLSLIEEEDVWIEYPLHEPLLTSGPWSSCNSPSN